MISFILVNYNTKEMTYETINDLKMTLIGDDYEMILVDNGSRDGSQCFFMNFEKDNSNFHYIYKEVNLGFSKANNIGASVARGDILVFLNTDIRIEEKGFDRFIIENLQDDIGIVAPQLLYENGSAQPNGGGFATLWTFIFQDFKIGATLRRLDLLKYISPILVLPFLKNTIAAKYIANFHNNSCSIRECDCVTGACMIIKKNIFKELKGFDERYFMYCEDEDLCRRVRLLGYRIVLNHGFKMKHLVGMSHANSPDSADWKIERFQSSIYYVRKHLGFLRANALKCYFVFSNIIKCLIKLFSFDYIGARKKISLAKGILNYELAL